MKLNQKKSQFSRTNLEYLESVYNQYQENPENVDEQWALFFQGVDFAKAKKLDTTIQTPDQMSFSEDLAAQELIKIYRDYGHLKANLDPLGFSTNAKEFESFKNLGLSSLNSNKKLSTVKEIGLELASLSEITDHLEKTYCQNISLQVAECAPKVRQWFWKEFEQNSFKLSSDEKIKILKQLSKTESLEKFIHTRYVGVKRFSIEGCDSLIPMLEHLVEKGSSSFGLEELIIGMSHRGRVNVLANFMNKALELIFAEFNGHTGAHDNYDADVKYHMGFSVNKETSDKKECHVSLAFNPSHLEAVNPVVCGMTRAKQRKKNDTEKREKVIPVLIHGDAAMIGQGVVSETFQLSQLKGYTVGGAIHIIMNNQVGFTTNPSDSRSTRYSSDIAKSVNAPVILVNADHPEDCVRAIDIALKFRQEFKQDIVIDMIGYRRFGHNEGDEPAFTQPQMYSKIKKHPTALSSYTEKLSAEKVLEKNKSKEFYETKINNLQNIFDEVKKNVPEVKPFAFSGNWEGFKWGTGKDLARPVKTTAKLDDLKLVMEKITNPPSNFTPHKKIQKLIQTRQRYFEEDKLDWGTTELLCYGSLILEGNSVRLSGQDSQRGTFTHRHSIYFDTKTSETYSPLAALSNDKEFCVYNSSLSEMAVLGFEYGNSISDPHFLTLWEAQFGDFANGAQIIIDQFISSGEAKWYRSNGLVLLLPHGYEGQGPEHSSARLERFLQLCAQNNMQVCNFTTPAQFFHAIRRQMKRNFKKPLIIMSPKSLLRHPKVISSKKDLTEGGFKEVISNELYHDATRVIFCSGKIYYDLLEEQERSSSKNVALIRIEQLYPFPETQVVEALTHFTHAKDFVWAQEEPQNMGAYWHIAPKIKKALQKAEKSTALYYAGRTERSSPATGAPSIHLKEQNSIIKSCFNTNS